MTIKKPVNQEFLNNELFAAANSGDYNQVVNFIDLGAEIDSAHFYNFTSLHAAAKRGHSQIVELLIEKGAKVDSPNNSGETALYSSAAAGNTNITKLLLDAGANKDVAVHNYTPLLIAAHYERVDDVNLLLEYGANMVSDNAYTAFNVAELKGIRNVAGKLIYDNVVSHYLKSLELLPIKFEVVIARFNENLDWAIKEFPYDKVTVYNKGPDDLKLPSNFEVIPLENTGRESHSYLHHIIKNFDNLAEKTLFLQGHPYEHPVFLPLARYKESLNSTCENIIAKCTDAFPTLIAKANNLKEQLDKNFKNFEVTYDLIEFTHNFISKEYVPNTTILTVNGAQFAINKQTILNHDISYYQGLINTLTNDVHPLVGYYFERLWDLVFSHEAKIVSGNYQLFQAASKGETQEVNRLLDMGADVNSKHDFGTTALTTASFNGHYETVESLIKRGANINSTGNNGLTALYAAASKGNFAVMELLLNAGADTELTVASGTIVDNRTPLYIAIKNRDIPAIELLLEHGANILSEDINSLLYMAAINADIERGKTEDIIKKERAIYELVINHYWKWLEHNPANVTASDRDFEVVVARYQEKDLSWLMREFPNEKVTIYNKDNETLTIEGMPNSYNIVNIPNFGWFGGTILHHIVNNYEHLADRTLFLQAAPYAVELFLPLERYKDDLPSKCENIFAKCITTSLRYESETFAVQSRIENWSQTKYRHFEHIDYNMIDFAHKFIDPYYSPDAPLHMVWGAEFAVDSDKIYNHKKEYYEKMLAEFQKQFPMADFFLGKLWNEVFAPPKTPDQLSKLLLQFASAGNTENVAKIIDAGADVNSKYERDITPLHIASASGNEIMADLLLSKGADVNIETNGKDTPLHFAIKNGHLNIVKLLVQHNAEVYSDLYFNPLALAARLEQHEMHQLLLKQYWTKLKQANANLPACPIIPDDNEFEVVIVRFNEDISWIADEFPCEKVTVYNAGDDDLPPSPYYAEIKIPNIGYYDGKIILHIVNNYHKLPDRVLFLQGNPYDTYVFLPLIRHKGELNSTCEHIIGKCSPGRHNLRAESIAMQNFDWVNGLNGMYKAFNHKGNDMLAFVNKFLGPIEEKFSICFGSQFAVNKDIILNHPIEYYQNLYSSINYAVKPIEAFYFERLWNVVLAPPKTPDQLSNLLFQAISMNDVQKVSNLLSLGANVTAINAQGDSLLNVAAHLDNSDIINLLLDAGASDKNIALTVAAYFGRYNAAKLLLESGAEAISDDLKTPLMVSGIHKNKTAIHKSIYELIINHYWNWLEHNPVNNLTSQNSFEVVIVHYKEDLSWVAKEFPNENITIYNKGPDDIIDMTPNCKIVNIDNVGWFGGTILYHIVNNYDHLADKTLFVQGDPYDQEIFLPLKRYANDLPSKCKNIIAKCTETTLLEQHNKLGNETSISRAEHHKYSCFEPVNHSIIDFAQEFIDPNYSPQAPLTMVWGAQFAVSADKVYNHEREYYEKILTRFQKQCPMDDFFLEKLWDEVF